MSMNCKIYKNHEDIPKQYNRSVYILAPPNSIYLNFSLTKLEGIHDGHFSQFPMAGHARESEGKPTPASFPSDIISYWTLNLILITADACSLVPH